MISFTVPSVPVAQPRQRHRVMSFGGNSFVKNYTPGKHPVNAFKSAVQVAAKAAYQDAPLAGPLSLRVVFVMPRPQKFCRKKDDPGRLWCITKPDLDNLVKALKDSLNKLTWGDDSQICRTIQTKLYAARDEQPCVEVEIEVI
jgi:Holliday junction resolvase RusA-like endonuclease